MKNLKRYKEDKETRGRMRSISLLVPKRILKEIERYCDAGFFSCRSEAIRVAIYVMLNDLKRFEAEKEEEEEG